MRILRSSSFVYSFFFFVFSWQAQDCSSCLCSRCSPTTSSVFISRDHDRDQVVCQRSSSFSALETTAVARPHDIPLSTVCRAKVLANAVEGHCAASQPPHRPQIRVAELSKTAASGFACRGKLDRRGRWSAFGVARAWVWHTLTRRPRPLLPRCKDIFISFLWVMTCLSSSLRNFE